jgi:hypothetical protein
MSVARDGDGVAFRCFRLTRAEIEKGDYQMIRLSILGLFMAVLASCSSEEAVSPEMDWNGLYRVIDATEPDSNSCDARSGSFGYLVRVTIDGSNFTWCGKSGNWDSTVWCSHTGSWNESHRQGVVRVDSVEISVVFDHVNIQGTDVPFLVGTKHEDWPTASCRISWQVFGNRIDE